MKTGIKILIILASTLTLFGVGISIYAYYIDRASLGNIVGGISLLVGLIGTVASLISKDSSGVVKQATSLPYRHNNRWLAIAALVVIASLGMTFILKDRIFDNYNNSTPQASNVNIQDTIISSNPGVVSANTKNDKESLSLQKKPDLQKGSESIRENIKLVEVDINPADLTARDAYQKGKSVANDHAMAAKYYQSAADRGIAEAAYELALLYQAGRGVAKNESIAFKYMKTAADAGYANAFRLLGEMYHGGRGVAKDRGMAESWYKKAADLGDEVAKKILYSM